MFAVETKKELEISENIWFRLFRVLFCRNKGWEKLRRLVNVPVAAFSIYNVEDAFHLRV